MKPNPVFLEIAKKRKVVRITEKRKAVRPLSLWTETKHIGISSLSLSLYVYVLIYSFILFVEATMLLFIWIVWFLTLFCLVTFDCFLVHVWVCVSLWLPMWSLLCLGEDSDICLTLLYFKMVYSVSDVYCQICVGKA